MSTLWTPDGERRIPRNGEPGAPSPGPQAPVAPPTTGVEGPEGAYGDEMSDEEMREVARALLSAPVEDVIANHCYGLFELAALHLSQRPANLDAARTAVDAMGLVIDGLGDRLGEHHATLLEGLTQLRLTWVKIAEAADAPGADGDG